MLADRPQIGQMIGSAGGNCSSVSFIVAYIIMGLSGSVSKSAPQSAHWNSARPCLSGVDMRYTLLLLHSGQLSLMVGCFRLAETGRWQQVGGAFYGVDDRGMQVVKIEIVKPHGGH